MEKMGSCPRSPKLTELNLGPRSLAEVDNLFPVFAPLVWHAGHADGGASWFGMPGMPGKKLACPARLILMFASASYPENHI